MTLPDCNIVSTGDGDTGVACSFCREVQKITLEPLEMYTARGKLFCSEKCRGDSASITDAQRIAVLAEHRDWLYAEVEGLLPYHGRRLRYEDAAVQAAKHIHQITEATR